jgi:dienelactone hydrolase
LSAIRLKELMHRAVNSVFLFCFAAAASGATLRVPAIRAPLTIDGVADEEIWKQATVLPVHSVDFGAPFPAGGEMRAVVRGGYLCLSARLPETARVVARSTGLNPVWWREDLVTWSLHFKSFSTYLNVSVNPLGGYQVEGIGVSVSPQSVLASASIGLNEWSAEAAIPLTSISQPLSVSVERIRPPRPDAPELRWYWPGPNDRVGFDLAEGSSDLAVPQMVTKDWSSPERAANASISSDLVAAELASVPGRVWTEGERAVVHPDQMWEESLRARVREAAMAERRDWEKIGSVADWEKFRKPRLDALRASLGSFPPRTPLRAEVVRRLDYGDGFVLESVIFESRPGLLVTANLYLPSKIAGRIPAIVAVHSHHFPKVQSELQDLGMTWARSGVAVLIMDQLGSGERLQSQPWLREGYYSRYAMGMQLYLAGDSLMKWMVWDLMRGIDLLTERPYVDPKRIIMLGAVAGGGDPAAVTAALDSRVAVSLPFNFGESSPEDHYTRGPRRYDFETADPGWGGWESTRCLRDSIARQFFPWFICASVAPRPFVFSFELSWPKGIEEEPAWRRYQKVFGLYGKTGNLDQVDGFGAFPGPGEVEDFGVNHRKMIYPILKRWLGVPMPADEYHNPRPDADLMCLTPRAAAERRPKTASEIALGIAETRLATAREARAALSGPQRLERLRVALREKLGDIQPNATASAHVVWTRSFTGFTVEAAALDTDPGIRIPLLLIKPSDSSRRFPVVLALAQGGKEAFLSQRRAELAALLQRGVAVCLADVRGAGEGERTTTRGPASTALAATELMLGRTALGERLKDSRSVLRYLRGRADLDASRVGIWGDSFAAVNPDGLLLDQSAGQQRGPQTIHEADPIGGLLALLTALYEDDIRGVAVHAGLISYRSVLRDRFSYVPLDAIVPGILEIADIADVVAALAPRAVVLEGLVDGRDRSVSAADASQELRAALTAYKREPSRLMVRDRASEPGLAGWIAAELLR